MPVHHLWAPVCSSFYQCGNAELPLEKLPLAEMILEGCQPKVLQQFEHSCTQGSSNVYRSSLPLTASVHTNVFQQHVLNFSSVSSNVYNCVPVVLQCPPMCTIVVLECPQCAQSKPATGRNHTERLPSACQPGHREFFTLFCF